MPDIAFSCPSCGQHLEAPDDMQGEQTSCPSCDKTLTVPRRTPARPRPAVSRPSPTSKPPTRKRSPLPIIVGVVAVFLIAGLGFLLLRPTAEKKVRNTLTAYLDGTLKNKPKEAYAVVSASDRSAKSEDEYLMESEDNPFGGVLTEHVSYTIDSIAVADAEATAYVTVTLPDLEQVMGSFMSAAFAAAFSEDEEEIEELQQKVKAKLESDDVPTVTEKETFHLVLEDSEWRMFLDWETQAREAAQRFEIQRLLADAKSQKEDGDPQKAIEAYSRVLELDSTSVAAQSGMQEATREIQSLRDKQDYLRNIELYDFDARYFEAILDGQTPGVTFKLRNNGNRALSEVKVTVFFRDRNNKVIYEDNYYPVNSSSWSSDSNKPLKPGYIWQMERGKFYTAKSVPDEWQEGNAVARIVDIEFEK
jgi:tetratricopeptide (TPR) repeat protein